MAHLAEQQSYTLGPFKVTLLPDGDLLFLFREGSSGNGDTFLNRYDTATRTWDNVHRSGTTQLPFLKGTGWSICLL